MKKIIFVLCTAALLQSCATYYYSKLGPAGNAGFKDEYGDFFYVQDIRGGTASRILGVVVLNAAAAAAAIEVQQMKNRSKEN